jgi:membrane fusion protein (multidrug efflux system)
MAERTAEGSSAVAAPAAPASSRAVPPAEISDHSAAPARPTPGRGRRKWFLLVGALAVAAVLGIVLYPRIRLALTTVSTDDAFVSSHATQVAPRIAESVVAVHVDDNDYVRKGDVLVELDPTMSEVRVREAKAAVTAAERSREQAAAKARSAAAQARANRFALASAITGVKNQAAELRAAVARWNEAKAAETLAQAEVARAEELLRRQAVTPEQADVRRSEAAQARARTREAREEVRRLRAALEVPEVTNPDPTTEELSAVPEDQSQRHSSVLSALGTLAVNLADLGVPIPSYYDTPDQFISEVRKRAPDGDIDKLIERDVAKAPAVVVAEAQVQQAKEQLAEAELSLSYCVVKAAIDGVVSNRNVNPGDRVAQGQRLMAIRSLKEVWIDCNFKETQLDPIRIGQPVDVTIDAYPGRVFRGRVTGFSPGTGAATALLPAQNATGNFVKIVQRLPVRVDLVGDVPADTPLFAGLSAEPHVRVYDKATGPNAGRRLRAELPEAMSR